jgi:hypothetical protein
MVKSTAAAVAGNWPSEKSESKFELIAFFGQVHVKVKGIVSKGDYIVPSGLNDGFGIAVSEDKLLPGDRMRVVGRAWESSSILGVKSILVAVGFTFSQASLQDDLVRVNHLHNELDKLKLEQKELIDRLTSKLDQQDKEIELLIKKLEEMKKL